MAKSLQELIDESIKNSEKNEEIVTTNDTEEKIENTADENTNVADENKEEIDKKDDEKPKKSKAKVNIGRGFKNLEEAVEFYESDAFAKWDDSAKKEFKTWLDKIKED